VRIRPLNERESLAGESSVWRTSGKPVPGAVREPSDRGETIEELMDNVGKQYRFDYLCHADETTTEMYKSLVRKVVLKACIGYNANVFCYGQTASGQLAGTHRVHDAERAERSAHKLSFARDSLDCSGKTHTTLGNEYAPGIVLLAIGDIFHYIAQSPNRQFLLRISVRRASCTERACSDCVFRRSRC